MLGVRLGAAQCGVVRLGVSTRDLNCACAAAWLERLGAGFSALRIPGYSDLRMLVGGDGASKSGGQDLDWWLRWEVRIVEMGCDHSEICLEDTRKDVVLFSPFKRASVACFSQIRMNSQKSRA